VTLCGRPYRRLFAKGLSVVVAAHEKLALIPAPGDEGSSPGADGS